MCKEFLVSKDSIYKLLNHLSKERTLVMPVGTGKVIEYRETAVSDIEGSGIDLPDNCISYKSIKEYYFPQTELMFTFDGDNITDKASISGNVIFGARPCDLEALRIMSIVYTTGKYADPFFQRRLDANFLIGVGCKAKKHGCFCQKLGIDMEYSDFCDIMLDISDDGCIITHLSDKARLALSDFPEVSSFNSNKQKKATQENRPQVCSENPPPRRDCPLPSLGLDIEKEDAYYFDVIDWEKATEACKGCGICTYICPTCYCFNFKDISKKDGAKRYKCWDSCMYPKFTLHASGHNPRENLYERYRQRVLHKYKYVADNFDGIVACTGCGRCIRSCRAGINIADIVQQIAE